MNARGVMAMCAGVCPELTEDALVEVYCHLDYLTLSRACSGVCKLWERATHSEKVWKVQFEREFGREAPSPLISVGWSWRELFVTIVVTMR